MKNGVKSATFRQNGENGGLDLCSNKERKAEIFQFNFLCENKLEKNKRSAS
jgi:hypothetical protein